MTSPKQDETAGPATMIGALRAELDAALAAKAALENTLAARSTALATRNTEYNERIEYQSATSDVLKAMSRSPGDPQPVFDLIVRRARDLCDAYGVTVYEFDGTLVYFRTATGISDNPEVRNAVAALYPMLPTRDMFPHRAIVDGKPIRIDDVKSEPGLHPIYQTVAVKSAVAVPLMRGDVAIGALGMGSRELGGFTDSQIELLKTFADQAVIAIENARLFNETKEALERQTATADILKIIASSPTNLQPVFDAIVDRARRLIGGYSTVVLLFDGERLDLSAFTSVSPDGDAALRSAFPAHVDSFGPFQLVREGHTIQFPDTEAEDVPLVSRDLARVRGYRSMIHTALMGDGGAIGMISVTRKEPGTFSEHHVQLLRTFADQAVIAIQNVKLFDEVQAKTRDLEEALTYQTGSANILKVIASSPSEFDPALKTIVESACELCQAHDATIALKDGDDLVFKAQHGSIPIVWDRIPINRRMVTGRAVTDGTPIQIRDLNGPEGDGFPDAREFARRTNVRSLLSVPLLREGDCIGVITLRRQEVNPFTDKQIALLQTFADQAVIAIENTRLFKETQEALERQTATAEILKVIAASPSDAQPVFEAIAERSNRLVSGRSAAVHMMIDGQQHLKAFTRTTPEADAVLQAAFPRPLAALSGAEQIRRGEVFEIADTEIEFAQQPALREMGRKRGYRSLVIVPLLRHHELIGLINVTRVETGRFAAHHIDLLRTFADQAVIAIENARLFNETKDALARQTATSDVLKVIASSPGDLSPVFDKMLENATRVCGAEFGSMNLLEADMLRQAALYNAPSSFAAARMNRAFRIHPRSSLADAIRGKQVVQVEDMRKHPAYLERNPSSVELTELAGARTIVVVPMLRQGDVIGVITVYRQEVRPFSDKQVELLTNFASQAVIAIENTRLLRELHERTDALSRSLNDLRAAQDRLVQTEKLASLGQLTAGIAHEIKNPLNFVNNFSALSAELTIELNDLLKNAALTDKMRGEVEELTRLLQDNLEKVVQHGKRADSIVKNMLLHSRDGSGEQRVAEINALVDESLNLAYHGARAEKSGFNVTLQRHFDANAGSIELFPQEITRALLNLISNGFYAATRRKAESGGEHFEPLLSASTKNLGTTVEIRIRDNGAGIPPDVREKMFVPFFTTKPTGEGTGLGLSMTHDIIVKQHGGRIDVETEPGAFTEFIITLPRSNGTAA